TRDGWNALPDLDLRLLVVGGDQRRRGYDARARIRREHIEDRIDRVAAVGEVAPRVIEAAARGKLRYVRDSEQIRRGVRSGRIDADHVADADAQSVLECPVQPELERACQRHARDLRLDQHLAWRQIQLLDRALDERVLGLRGEYDDRVVVLVRDDLYVARYRDLRAGAGRSGHRSRR